MLNMMLTLMAAYVGAMIAKKLRFPAPYMIGAMMGAACLNVFTSKAFMPTEIKNITQAVTGIYVGKSIFKKDVKNLRHLILPIIILIGGFMLFTMVMGVLLNWLFHLDKASAFLVSVPGGVVNMSLMSYDFNADPSTVSLIQVFRLFSVLLIFPPLIGKISKHVKVKNTELMIVKSDQKDTWIDRFIPETIIAKNIFTLGWGLLGGWIGYELKIPAGPMTFSMIFIAIANCCSKKVELPMAYRRVAQIFAGSIAGAGIGMSDILGIRYLIFPAMFLMCGYVVINVIISYLISKTGKVDFISAMFASSPGGASDMALIAGEIGGESPKVAILQVSRAIAVNTVYPLFVSFLIKIYV